MQLPNTQNDARECPRIDFREEVKVKPFARNQRFRLSPAYARFTQELAYYEADKPYLTVEKCAARCALLSQLLTVAVRDTAMLRW